MLFKTTPKPTTKKLNIAVIGGGISGLGAAYSLAAAHKVTIFEARTRLGGHARTLVAGRHEQFRVDTGFMVFNYRNYPNLNALFDQLNIPVKPTDMSFAVTLDDGKFEYGLHHIKKLLADPLNAMRPGFWKMIADILKFNKHGQAFKDDPDISIGSVIEQLQLSDQFRDRYLGPLAGAIWSTSSKDMLNFPAQSLIRFFKNHGLMSVRDSPAWFTVDGGSQIYVDRFEKTLLDMGCDMKINEAVRTVQRNRSGVTVKTKSGFSQTFDQIVFACHSDQALKMLASPSTDETDILGSIKYKNNTVVLHDDPNQMPKRRACWSSWVYKGSSDDQANNSFTYWMNSLQDIPETSQVFVTLNPQEPIPDEHIYNVTELAHPQFDLPALKAQKRLPDIQGVNRSWYCGAYTKYGFHEDGFTSGLAVGHQIHAGLETV